MTRALRRGAMIAVLSSVAILAVPASAQSPPNHQHHFGDAGKWAQVFDDPARDAWQKPHEVLRALKLAPGAAVADIGSGTGYFAVRLAHMLPQGTVFGVDLEPDMVKYLAARAKKEGLANLISVAGATDDPRLPTPVDLAILIDVYHHIGNREAYFRKLRGSIKPGGRIAIIDFSADSPIGPPKSARVAPEQVKAELRKAGYALTEEHAFLPHQYFLIFRPGV